MSIERPAPADMIVHWRPTTLTRGLPHEVSMAADYASAYEVLCDGAAVPFTAATGRATFVCPDADADADRTFEVKGTPAP